MPDIVLPISNGNLPEGFCPQTEQDRANAYAAILQVIFPFNMSVINTGSTAPTADNRIYPWYRSNPDGTPDRLYSFVNGAWIAPNPTPASSPMRFFYRGSLGSIDTYDGGESGAITDVSGPMWQVDTDMAGRIPIGANDDFPLNSTGGSSTITRVPEHFHGIGNNFNNDYLGFVEVDWQDVGNQSLKGRVDIGSSTPAKTEGNLGTTLPVPEGEEDQSIMNPWLGGFWVRRTSRIFYRI